MTRRRLAIVILFALVLALVLAPAALAAAGGGSAGFGGGLHGGGGGGRGAALYILLQVLIRIAIFGHGLGLVVVIGLVLIYLLVSRVRPGASQWWASERRAGRTATRAVARRERSVELAAAQAAEDDPSFAPGNVRVAAAALFAAIQAAWDAGDRDGLRALVAPALLAEWERRLDDFERRSWRNRVEPLAQPKIEYVGLTHPGDRRGDRVVVRIEARLRDYVQDSAGNRIKRTGRVSETVRMREFWTLARRMDRSGAAGWILLSIEQGAEGQHELAQALVASPWSDERGMRDEALVEGAVAEAVPEGTDIAELADLDFEGDARAAALDLSLVDGRFAPDVLEVSARRAVRAWAQAVDGGAADLLAIASPRVAQQLLHPDDPGRRTRLVVRGPQVRQIRIEALDAAGKPPTMTLEVALEGRRYIEDRATAAVVSGSPSRAIRFTEHWTLALNGDAAQPWRIVAVDAPVGGASAGARD